ncbi:protein of unknown function [Rhodovastum atsumiense]|nr:HEAT repeat domain-containing protein [Rhodovastum atsumiense]CAH2602883.1 protein of unknown function [Rhodovastum atsumiense]
MFLITPNSDDALACPEPERPLLVVLADLDAADPCVRRTAVREIARHSDATTAIPLLSVALRGETVRYVQHAVLSALIELATPAAIDVLIGVLSYEDAWMRNTAAMGLEEIGEPAAPRVRALLSAPDPDLRIAGMTTLAGMRHPPAIGWIIEAIRSDPDVNVCAAGVEALERIGTATAIPDLRALARRFPHDSYIGFAVDIVCERLETAP